MRKSPLSLSILFFFIFLALIRVAELTISLTLNRYSRIVSYAFQKDLGLKASFSKIDFSLASGLRFTDFYLYKDNDKVAFLKELRLGIFLPRLWGRQLCIDRIFLREGWVPPGMAKYKDYLFFNLKRLIADSRKRNTKSLSINFAHPRIYINRIKIYLDKDTSAPDFVLINAAVSQRRENLICKSSIDFGSSRFNNLILKPLLFYKFTQKINVYLQLAFMGDDLLVNNVVISSDNIKISGAGIIYNLTSTPFVDLKLITLPLNLKELVNLKSKIVISGLLNIIANLKGKVSGLQLETQMLMSKSEFYLPFKLVRLSNVSCNIYFKNNEIIIKDLNALINYRFPVSLQGKISNFANPQFVFRIESFKTRGAGDLSQETSNLVFDIEARLDGEDFKGNADFGMTLEKRLPHYLKRREIKTTLRNLRVPFRTKQVTPFNIMLFADEVSVSNRQILNNNPMYSYEWKLDNLTSKLMIKPEGSLDIEMQGFLYQGKVEGQGGWDLANARSGNYFLLKFIDLEAGNFMGLFPMPTIISGKLNGVLYLTNGDFGGVITVAKGAISKFNLIDNIADFLGINSIKELRDIFLMVDFLANRSSIEVKRFNLRNLALNLVSSFTINDKEWITGTASLSLSKETLEESDILRRLIDMVGETNKRIGLDFRVSGFSKALRVELLEGEFRNRLLAGLKSNIRSQIETEIDKAVISFRDKNIVR